jgi:hypothetical protein
LFLCGVFVVLPFTVLAVVEVWSAGVQFDWHEDTSKIVDGLTSERAERMTASRTAEEHFGASNSNVAAADSAGALRGWGTEESHIADASTLVYNAEDEYVELAGAALEALDKLQREEARKEEEMEEEKEEELDWQLGGPGNPYLNRKPEVPDPTGVPEWKLEREARRRREEKGIGGALPPVAEHARSGKIRSVTQRAKEHFDSTAQERAGGQ